MASEPDQICSICHRQPQLTDTRLTGNISDKLSSIFSIFLYSSHQSRSGSHVFHGEIMYTYSMPEPNQNMPYLSPSTEFCKIPQTWANSAARLRIPRSAKTVVRNDHEVQ